MVGPLNVRDARPLPPDLEEFVRNSGAMVLSLFPLDQMWPLSFHDQ